MRTRNSIIAAAVAGLLLSIPSAVAQFPGQIPAATVLGNAGAVQAPAKPVPSDGTVLLTGGAIGVRTFGAAQSGIVPQSGGGSSNFLRADGTWASPSGGCTAPTAFAIMFADTGPVCAGDAARLFWTKTDNVTIPYSLNIATNDTTGVNGAVGLNVIGGNASRGGAARFSQTAGGGGLRAGYSNTTDQGYIDARDNSGGTLMPLSLNAGVATVSIGTSNETFVGQPAEHASLLIDPSAASRWWIGLGNSSAWRGGLYADSLGYPALRFWSSVSGLENTTLSSNPATVSSFPGRLSAVGLRDTTILSCTGTIQTDADGDLFCGGVAGVITGTVVNGEVVKGTGANTVGTTGITLPAAPASTQCLQMTSGGAIQATGTGCNVGGGGGITGLFAQVLSATPTSASTGFSTWVNQGSATVTDSATGIALSAASNAGSNSFKIRTKTAPATPYTAKFLVAITPATFNNFGTVSVGWTDGTKLQTIDLSQRNAATSPLILVNNFNTVTSFNATVLTGTNGTPGYRAWFSLSDDGTNVSFGWSNDGENFQTLYTVAKASGFLGASGYTTLLFGIDPHSTAMTGTMMSYTQS